MKLTTLRSGDLHIDLQSKSVHLSGESLSLTPTSFELLCYLFDKSPEVISVEEILVTFVNMKVHWMENNGGSG